MEQSTEVFVRIDVAKARNAVAVADGERNGEVRFLGEVATSDDNMRRLVKHIVSKHLCSVQSCQIQLSKAVRAAEGRPSRALTFRPMEKPRCVYDLEYLV